MYSPGSVGQIETYSPFHSAGSAANEENPEQTGIHCTHCSAFIPPSQLKLRKHGKPGYIQKCDVCLANNRKYDAKRRRRITSNKKS